MALKSDTLNGFDPIARWYDRLARFVFGKALSDAQTCHLSAIPAEARILVLGGGTGWWLPMLFKMNPHCEVWYVEASEKMIAQAQKNLSVDHPIHFVHSTVLPADLPGSFDVVITYFFMDLFDTDEAVARSRMLFDRLSDHGSWLMADFVNKRWWHGALLWVMYKFFNVLDMVHIHRLPDWDEVLQGWKPRLTQSFFGDFIQSTVYQKRYI